MQQFKLSHSFLGVVALLVVEWLLVQFVVPPIGGIVLVILAAVGGGFACIYAATEVIEEVHGALHMLRILSLVVIEFVVFFAFQYWFLLQLEPASFPALGPEPVSLLLHSVMVFVFNPLYLPGARSGELLLLVETLESLGLVLFILQNVGQFRRKTLDTMK